MRVFLVIAPSFFFIVWAIEIPRANPSIPVAFYAQPRAVGPGFEPGSPAYHAGVHAMGIGGYGHRWIA
jgi:hypothetical protein